MYEITEYLDAMTKAHPSLTGVYLLGDGQAAFSARVMLARTASVSLDIQYYIWHADATGCYLFNELLVAAERGVKVRLLLDDNNTKGLDPILQSLSQHPNIDIKLYNPNRYRRFRPIGLVTEFVRLNRRMHNKSMIMDGKVSITGGRNIGDEYFDMTGVVMFADLDTLLVGDIVPHISTDFDRYWYSASAVELSKVIKKPTDTLHLAKILAIKLSQDKHSHLATYLSSLTTLSFVEQLREQSLHFYWAKVTLVSDDPSKTMGKSTKSGFLGYQLFEHIGLPQHSLDIVSPYFVPTKAGSQHLIGLKQNGVAIRILTNALSATDVAIVHAGYQKYRTALLSSGMQLFELKPKVATHRIKDNLITGHSASSLHAKTFIIDHDTVFIGSFNFDPRSARLNTEMGLVIKHPSLVALMKQGLSEQLPTQAYQVKRERGLLTWHSIDNGQLTIHHTEPDTSRLQRGIVQLMSHLPIEILL